jgi:hypothetical protein
MSLPANASLDIAHLIQTAVGPVFLLSGIATTLNVLMGRLARVIDRARLIEERPLIDPQLARSLQADLRVLARRARFINAAITLTTLSALLVALTVVLLFANPLVSTDLSITIAIVFVAALVALVGALISFLIEARIATASLRIGEITAEKF